MNMPQGKLSEFEEESKADHYAYLSLIDDGKGKKGRG